ncbi:unnamed protein product [Symbiodinium sp. CCMP2592]|nr:unnamed protein product [Symbiodinium sp. CCMP2592]
MCLSWFIHNISPFHSWSYVVSLSVLCTVWVAYTALTCRSLALKLSLLLQETSRVRGGPARKQAIWAAHVVGMEMLICAVLGLGICVYGIFSGLCLRAMWRYRGSSSEANLWLMLKWIELLQVVIHSDWVVNSLGLGLLSGILWQVQPPEDDPQSERLARGLVSMSSSLSPSEQEVYHQVVKQIASRGLRLGTLLSFWEQLQLQGEVMPGFDPRRSVTNDVVRRVRRVIIPESRVGNHGCALASLWSGAETKPHVMVTHNWTNGFGSLVSAILADALGQASYDEVVAQIATS